MVRCQDIADMVGVSRQAVSAVLNGRGNSAVSSEKRERILALARKLNYRPNRLAQKLASGCSRVIGFCAGNVREMLRSPVYPGFIDFIVTELAERGYELSLLAISKMESGKLLEVIRSGQADGVICHAKMLDFEPVAPEDRQRIVTFANTTAPDDIVTDFRISGEEAVIELAEHLYAQGFRKIAYIGSPNLRAEQHREIFEAGGIPFAPELFFTEGNYRNDPGDALAAFEVVHYHWDKLKKCDAIVFNNDCFARGGCAALRLHGVEPGVDIAVSGHDALHELPEDFLTTSAAPYDRLAQLCAERICRQITGNDPAFSPIRIPSRLIIRKSTGIVKNI